MQTSPHKHLVVVTDGTDDIQRWLDAVVLSAQQDEPAEAWPHPHPRIPPGTVTVGQLVQGVEKYFAVDGVPWSVVIRGFPPPPRRIDGDPLTDGADPDHPRPTNSNWHNLMHNLRGDFH